METLGIYSVTLDSKNRFNIPANYDIDSSQILNLARLVDCYEVKDKTDARFKITGASSLEMLSMCRQQLNNVEIDSAHRLRIPKRIADRTLLASKMVVVGKNYYFKVLTESEFLRRAQHHDFQILERQGNSGRIILKYTEEARMLEIQSICDFKVDGKGRVLLKRADFIPKEKVYCLYSDMGLEIYHKHDFLELLSYLNEKERKRMINYFFTLKVDQNIRMVIDRSLCPHLIRENAVSVMKTNFGALIPTVQKNDNSILKI